MGLSEEDKKRHPYFRGMQAKEEKERWEKAMQSPEYVQHLKKFRFAFEEHLYQRVAAYFKAVEEKRPSAELVVSSTYLFTQMICDETMYARPLLTEKMLRKFGLVKKEKK